MAGAMTGYPDGSLQPDRSVTRGEAVALLGRLSGTLYNKAVTDARKETMGNAVINTQNVILRNKEITDNLYLAPGINGDVTVESTNVAGTTFINSGGQNTIHIKSSNLAEVVLFHSVYPVRLAVEGESVIQKLELRSSAVIQTNEGASIQTLILRKGSSGTMINGKGEIIQIVPEAEGIRVNGKELEKGKKYVWSSDREVLVPADEKTTPGNNAGIHTGGGNSSPNDSNSGTDNNTGSQPSVPWAPMVGQGDFVG